jgi:pimeloyl-ACP methyl ester carboxylesterase
MPDLTAWPRRSDPVAASPRSAELADVVIGPLVPLRPPWPGRRIPVGESELYVRTTAGQSGAEPAVYVHGLGGSSTNWTDLAGLLAPWLDGAALDLPGFGRSAPAARNDYSTRAHVRTVVAYLEQAGRGPVHLFGNSMGGAIAITVAVERPDLVRSLTLISPAVPDLRPRVRRQDPVLPLMMVPRLGALILRRMERASPEARVRGMQRLCYANPSSIPPERMAEAVAEIRYRAGLGWSTDALVRSLRGLVATYFLPPARGWWAQLAQITAPTLVIWGDRDRLVSVARAPRTARVIPNSRLLVVPDVGHVAQMERPDIVARAVVGMLDELARPAAAVR